MSITPPSSQSIEDIQEVNVDVHILPTDNNDQESPQTSSALYTHHCLSPNAAASPGVATYNPRQAACSVAASPSSERESVKRELLKVIQRYREDMMQLMVSLTGTDISSLTMLDDDGFAQDLAEAIQLDCSREFNKQIKCVLHLYKYFYNKGHNYKRIGKEWFKCTETMGSII